MSNDLTLNQVLDILKINPLDGFFVISAAKLVNLHIPPFPPSAPALLLDLTDDRLPAVQKVLENVYPEVMPLNFVRNVASGEIETSATQLKNLAEFSGIVAVLVPALGEETSLESFQEVIARLRAPDGCPWDREQTHDTLRKHLLEETYEALVALDSHDIAGMREEFGDLLLQIVLHSQIALEANEFRMADILEGIHNKIVRRHPHVFGDSQVEGVSHVLQNWEKLKAAERQTNGESEHKGILDGVAAAFPALAQAQEFQDRAARVGFDWPDVAPVLEKVMEEIEEVRTAADGDHRAKELGDLLFAVVNFVRWHKVDAETVLREANQRFRRRFAHIEKRARQMDRDLSSMTLAEMDALWDEAKKLEQHADH